MCRRLPLLEDVPLPAKKLRKNSSSVVAVRTPSIELYMKILY